MALGLKGFEADLSKQIDACRRASALYGALMFQLSELWTDPQSGFFRELLSTCWEGRAFAVWYERPLLLGLVLHDMVLAAPAGSHPLHDSYPSRGGRPELLTRAKVREALVLLAQSAEQRQFLRSGFVQTNETTRGVAWLWPLALLAEKLPRQLALFDLGASAGLNLVADRLPAIWADGFGKPLALSPIPAIIGRVGYDRAPVSVLDPVQVRRLRAAIWADDLVRLARLDQALGLASELTRAGELRVDAADLLEMPARIFDEVKKHGKPALVYHTVATDYLPIERRNDFERFMRDLILELPDGSLWVEFESARSTPGVRMASGAGPMELRAHWNLGGMLAHETLARAAAHPLTLQIDAKAVERLLAQA